jgi:hypothetical protein
MELSSGRSDRLITDRSVTQFTVSLDEKEVAFSAKTAEGVSEIWLASTDRSTPPRRIAQNADSMWFAGSDLVFRSLEATSNFIERIGKDGSGRRRVIETPILELTGVSPDGKWATAGAPGEDQSRPSTIAVSLDSGASRSVCARCEAFWAQDGKWIYAVVPGVSGTSSERLAVALGATQEPPPALSALLAESAKGTVPPGTRVIGHEYFAPGSDPSTYAYAKTDVQRNLFRIPLH